MGSDLFGFIGIWNDFKGPYSSRPVLVQEGYEVKEIKLNRSSG